MRGNYNNGDNNKNNFKKAELRWRSLKNKFIPDEARKQCTRYSKHHRDETSPIQGWPLELGNGELIQLNYGVPTQKWLIRSRSVWPECPSYVWQFFFYHLDSNWPLPQPNHYSQKVCFQVSSLYGLPDFRAWIWRRDTADRLYVSLDSMDMVHSCLIWESRRPTLLIPRKLGTCDRNNWNCQTYERTNEPHLGL